MRRRDDFSERTKRTLAQRVAYRCSYPGCTVSTIGPRSGDADKVVSLGQAAHITAASPGGPRYDSTFTEIQRKAVENGVWMCTRHAKLIDDDCTIYSAETIRKWKRHAEGDAQRNLRRPGTAPLAGVTTLVQLGTDLVFEGYWTGATETSWDFDVATYLYGDETNLKDFVSGYAVSSVSERFVVIESQGDGRLMREPPSWKLSGDLIRISTPIATRLVATDPNRVGASLAFDIEKGDLVVENGTLALVRGKEAAIQKLSYVLGSVYQDSHCGFAFGSLFHRYFADHNEDKRTAERLLKLEISRLASLPVIGYPLDQSPPLGFVRRVLNVTIEPASSEPDLIRISLKLEWGTGDVWCGSLPVRVGTFGKQIGTDTPGASPANSSARKGE
jgi:hypothetical protein